MSGLIGLAILIIVALVIVAAVSTLGAVFKILIPLLIWALIGYLAGQIMRGKGYGLVGDVLLGLIGGIVGGFVLGLVGLGFGGIIGTILSGVVGAVLVIFVVRMVHDADFAK